MDFGSGRGLDKEFCREAIEGGTGNRNNLDAEFAKGAKFRGGRTGNGNNLNAEGAEVLRRAQRKTGFVAIAISADC